MAEISKNKELKFTSARGIVSLIVRGETRETYIVCTAEELKASREAGREPQVLGFRKADVVK
jgi:hypothetical protein